MWNRLDDKVKTFLIYLAISVLAALIVALGPVLGTMTPLSRFFVVLVFIGVYFAVLEWAG